MNGAMMMSGVKGEKNIDETLEVNEMLIDAIKAKLAILDDINWLLIKNNYDVYNNYDNKNNSYLNKNLTPTHLYK